MPSSAAETSLRIERDLAHPPDAIFDAWTNPGTVAVWFAPPPLRAEVQSLDRVSVAATPSTCGPDDSVQTAPGVHEHIERPHRLVMGLGSGRHGHRRQHPTTGSAAAGTDQWPSPSGLPVAISIPVTPLRPVLRDTSPVSTRSTSTPPDTSGASTVSFTHEQTSPHPSPSVSSHCPLS